MTEHNPLQGMRILVVEDSVLVGEVVCEVVQSFGCDTVGPMTTVGAASEEARTGALDGAILDVNLNGRSSAAVAEELESRDIPFLFMTGYDSPDRLPEGFRGRPRIGKPFDETRLRRLISTMISERRGELTSE